MSIRLASRSGVVLAAAAAGGLLVQVTGGDAYAQGRLDARYTASLAGLHVGRGAWVVDIGEDKYLAAASGVTAGLMRLFSGGEGTGAARGSIVNGKLVPSSYAASITTSSRLNEVRFALKGGAVKEMAVSPPVTPESGRVPLKDAHRRGVIDPMTASLIRVPGKGNPLVPSSCKHAAHVFDGRMRYDLSLAYKRMGQVKAAKGYAGPALVCSVYFAPVAGYIPDRLAIRYLREMRDMELWLTPIAGTSVLVPFRATIPTPFGFGVLEATQYLSVATRTRAATSGAAGP